MRYHHVAEAKEEKRIKALQKAVRSKKYGIAKKWLVRGTPSMHVVCSTISNGTQV